MISASKTTFNLENLKILRPKFTKNLTNLLMTFCKFPPIGIPRNFKRRVLGTLKKYLLHLLTWLRQLKKFRNSFGIINNPNIFKINILEFHL